MYIYVLPVSHLEKRLGHVIRFQPIGGMNNLFVDLKIRFKVFLNVKRPKDNRTKI